MIETRSLLAIAAMGLVTYACRAGGLWMTRRFRAGRYLDAWLEQLPGAVFAALIGPMVVAAGPAGWIAGAVGFALMRQTGHFLIAMIGGLTTYVALHRLVWP